MFADFSGIPDFHKSEYFVNEKPIVSINYWKHLESYCCFNNENVVSDLS